MLHKTRAIVLGQLKYTDNKKIITLFTRSAGKKKLMLTHSKSKKNKNSHFQLPQILEIVFNEKNTTEFISLKEINIVVPLKSIYSNAVKLAISLFLVDVIDNATNFNYDENFYDFVETAIILLDKCEHPANFHIAFLLQVAFHLGIMPTDNFSEVNKFFDIRTGEFSPVFSVDFTFTAKTSKFLHEFIQKSMQSFVDIPISRSQRNDLTEHLLKYFSFHYPTIKFKSLKIIQEIF